MLKKWFEVIVTGLGNLGLYFDSTKEGAVNQASESYNLKGNLGDFEVNQVELIDD